MKPELKKGDRVVLYFMEGESSLSPGTFGTVTEISEIFGDKQYGVDWDNGSKLALISSSDVWDTEENYIKRQNKKKKSKDSDSITEQKSNMGKHMKLVSNMSILKHFDATFLRNYLKMVRDSGITNMYGASPYLYIGREKIEQELAYKDLEGEEYDEILDNADRARTEMIRGTVSYLESENIEVSIENVQKYLPQIARIILETYILTY